MTPLEQFYALCGLLGFCYITFCFLTGTFSHQHMGDGQPGLAPDDGAHTPGHDNYSYGKFTDHPHLHVDGVGEAAGSHHAGHGEASHGHSSSGDEPAGKALSDSAKLAAVGPHGRKRSSMDIYIWFLRFFSPLRLALLLFFYGVIGFLISRHLPLLGQFSQIIAISSAFIITAVLQNIMSWLLSYGEVSKTFEKQDLIGYPAEIALPVQEGQTGEITYTVGGVKYTGPARAADNQLNLPRFTKVMISDYKDFVFYVKPWGEDIWLDSGEEMPLLTKDSIKELDNNT